MPKDSLGDLDEVARLLALLVRLQLGNQTSAISELSRAGFSPSRIAGLLGTTAGTVSVTLQRAKNRKPRTTLEG
jgi:DNA-directed RNA polymerase specialized sigma24 family protein